VPQLEHIQHSQQKQGYSHQPLDALHGYEEFPPVKTVPQPGKQHAAQKERKSVQGSQHPHCRGGASGNIVHKNTHGRHLQPHSNQGRSLP
jgi:hypothetical protein